MLGSKDWADASEIIKPVNPMNAIIIQVMDRRFMTLPLFILCWTLQIYKIKFTNGQ